MVARIQVLVQDFNNQACLEVANARKKRRLPALDASVVRSKGLPPVEPREVLFPPGVHDLRVERGPIPPHQKEVLLRRKPRRQLNMGCRLSCARCG